MSHAGSLGRIITFYSFKGGTGRTMALANVAYLLSHRNPDKKILMVDWDLEAPGLHRYAACLMRQRFPGHPQSNGFDSWPGLIDLFQQLEQLSETSEAPTEALDDSALDRYILKTDVPGLHLMKAGRFDTAYSSAVIQFQWEALHTRAPWLFATFAKRLAEGYDYVLIDARTGLTDAGGICTSIMPDTLVAVFTPNRQSLLGCLEIVAGAANYRKQSDDLRPLRILPLPSRIEAAEPSLRERWRFGDASEDVPGYQPLFEDLFCSLYGLTVCDLSAYFSEVQIQHVPRFAYGEEIAARVEPADRLSLTRSFEHFVNRIVSGEASWDSAPAQESAPAARPAADEAWIDEKRSAAEAALKKLMAKGYMEASFFLSTPLEAIPSPRLFYAAQAAQVPGTGWPIGAVVGTGTESRPRPTPDGLVTEIVDKATKSYDYWSLRSDGSFYFFRNLEEEPEYLLTDDRVSRVAELLLYCKRLYGFLGVEPSTRVLISLLFTGLAGRALGCRNAEAPETLQRLTPTCIHERVASETVVELAEVQRNLDGLVENLTTPLFANFDFYQLPAAERARLITKNLADWGMA